MAVIAVGGVVPAVPRRPTLLSPVSGAYTDLVGTPTFVWQYNPGQAGNSQTGWQFYVVVGGGVAQYWDATAGGFTTTPTWNSGSPVYGTLTNSGNTWAYQFPSASFMDGIPYQWTVASQDANGNGPPAGFFIVNAQSAPVVTVYVTNTSSACPLISWAAICAPGAQQINYRLVIYTADQVAAMGFTPGSGPSVYDTAVVQGSANSLDFSTLPFYLNNGVEYYAYVQVAETFGQLSAWAFADWTPSYTPVPVPDPGLTAVDTTDPMTGCPMIQLLAGNPGSNLLPTDDADPTLGVGTWAGNDGTCTVSSGADGLDVTPVGTPGTMQAINYAVPVSPNTEYSFMASFLSAAAGQNAFIAIQFYDASVDPTSEYESGTITDNSSTPTQAAGVATSGPDDAYASLFLIVYTPGEDHFVTEIGIIPGDTTDWSPGGGGGGSGTCFILRSDGAYVRGASINNQAAYSGGISINDYEAIVGVTYTYTITVVTGTSPDIAVSDPQTSNAVELTTNGWWELDPNDPSGAVSAQAIEWEPQVTEQSTAHLVMGQATPNVVTSNIGGTDGSATFETFDPVTYAALEALLQSQSTIWVSSPFGASDSTYARFGPQTGGLSSGTGNKVKDSTLLPASVASMHRTTAVTFVAQARPPV